MPGDVDLDDLPYEDILSDDEELEMKKENRKRQELLAKVDLSRYTAGQAVDYSAQSTSQTPDENRETPQAGMMPML